MDTTTTTTTAATAAHHQWPQGIGVVKTMEATRPAAAVVEKKQRPQKDQALNCPRCNSTNTKFCYYNNYSLSQPRYFCKTCRRYWTEGGSLRNVPVGGGSRKNKRPPSSSSSSPSSLSSPSTKKLPAGDHHHLLNPRGFPQSASQNNPRIYEGQDLNLAYPPSSEDYGSKFVEPPYGTETRSHHHQNPSTTAQTTSSAGASHHMSAMELLKTGMNSRGLSSFMPTPVSCSNAIYSSTGFPLHEFKSSLNFSLQGFESEYGSIQGMQENSTAPRLLFPMEDLKQEVPSNSNEFDEQNRGQGDATGYWNGMLGGGGSW